MCPSPAPANPRASGTSVDGTTFADLGVPADLVAVLDRAGIESPFEIQAATIPDALAGRDVLGRAPTGSGKTLAFGLPMLATMQLAKPRRPTGLILSPTRELAEQIRRDLDPLAKARGLAVLAVYGGVGFGNQLKGLRNGDDLVVATPGRLIDLIQQREIFLDRVSSVVVDEADRMADMGFLPVVKEILDLTNSDRQTVMFSATLGKEVKVLTDRYQTDPVTHTVGSAEPDLSQVNHRFIKADAGSKVAITAHLVLNTGPTIVFCRTRHGSDRLARQLSNAGLKTAVIHGNRSQNQRDAALRSFTQGKSDALVATDVAARGIHVDGVACVIHFDPPAEKADYVHRSGRTARAGASGEVVSLINASQQRDAKKLQKQLALSPDIEETPEIDYEAFQAESRKRSLRRTKVGQKKSSGKAGGRNKAGGRSTDSRRPVRDNQGTGSSSKPSSKAKPSSSTARHSPSNTRPGGPPNSSPSSGQPRTAGGQSEQEAGDRPVRRSASVLKRGTKKKKPSRLSDAPRDAASRPDKPRSSSSRPGTSRGGATASKPSSHKRQPAQPAGDKPEVGRPSPTKPPKGKAAGPKSSAGKATAGKAKAGKDKSKTTKRSGKPRPKRKKGGPKSRKAK